MIGPLALGLLALAGPQAGSSAPVPPAQPPAVARPFEAMWSEYVAADAASDQGGVARAMREIRRARMERNVESLGSVGLALVAHAYGKLQAGKRDEAEQEFRAAVALAPGLPDAHAGLSLALLRKGPLSIAASLDASVTGVSAFLATGRGARTRARPRDDRGARRGIRRGLGDRRSRCSPGTAGCCCTTSRSGWARRTTARRRWACSCCCCCCRSRRSRAGAGCRSGGSRCCSRTSESTSGRSRLCWRSSALLVGPGVALVEERLRTTRNPLYHAALASHRVGSGRRRDREPRAGAAAGSGGPRPRVPARRRPQEGRPLRRGRRALPPGARSGPAGRRRAQQPREPRVRARRLRRGERALPRRHQLAAAGRGRHLPLQPVARAPAEVRLPGLQRGQVEGGPHRAGPRRRLRPLEVRHGRVRGRGPRPRARAGLREVRGGRVGSRGRAT